MVKLKLPDNPTIELTIVELEKFSGKVAKAYYKDRSDAKPTGQTGTPFNKIFKKILLEELEIDV